MGQKNNKVDLGKLGASLLWNMFAGQVVIRECDGVTRGLQDF